MSIDLSKIPDSPGIYEMVNEATNESYVGQSATMRSRIRAHLCQLRRGQSTCALLQKSFSASGEQAFSIRILDQCPEPYLNSFEARWIEVLNPALNSSWAHKPVKRFDRKKKHHSFHGPTAGAAVGCESRKFGEWWYRTRAKLKKLLIAEPEAAKAELRAIMEES